MPPTNETLTLSDLENLLARVRGEIRQLRVKGPPEYGRVLKEKGLYEAVCEKFLENWTLPQVQAWLKKEHGVEISQSTLSRMRMKVLGKRVSKMLLEELEKTEEYLNPVKNLIELMSRLEARYKKHVEMEETLGMPLHDQALKILELMMETNMCLVQALEKAGVLDAAIELKAKVEGQVSVSPELDTTELARLVLAAAEAAVAGNKNFGLPLNKNFGLPLKDQQDGASVSYGDDGAAPGDKTAGS